MTTRDARTTDGHASDQPADDEQRSGGVWADYSTPIIGGMIVAVIAAGSVTYRFLEGWSWLDSVYFSVITLTTVGFGDLTPSTSASKIFTLFYVVTGISLLGAALNEILKRRARRVDSRIAHGDIVIPRPMERARDRIDDHGV